MALLVGLVTNNAVVVCMLCSQRDDKPHSQTDKRLTKCLEAMSFMQYFMHDLTLKSVKNA